VLLVKFAMDYVFIVHALVVPSRAIMQIDLYCWNYNFAGEDCDQYDYAEAVPVVVIQAMRLFRRYAYKLLMLFERWLPNLMLYYCNTFFYYLAALGFASAFSRFRWRGVRKTRIDHERAARDRTVAQNRFVPRGGFRNLGRICESVERSRDVASRSRFAQRRGTFPTAVRATQRRRG
jgi:hypothetical protein